MRSEQILRRHPKGDTLRALALAVGAVGLGLGVMATRANASAIDVSLSRTTSAADPVTTENPVINIPDAPGVTYDAADTTDSGTTWNSLITPTVTHNDQTGSNLTSVVEQNLSLVDSHDNVSPIAISQILFTEGNGKNDTIHQTGIVAGTNPGLDGLSSNPALLMNQSWVTNGTAETITFSLTGLVPSSPYALYIYGAGGNIGSGGTYTLPAANQGVGYIATAGNYSTEPNKTGAFRSVFDSTGINPTPELGLSWQLLPAVADASGDLSFTVNTDLATGIKGSINGFQLDTVNTPEPASLGFLAVGAAALLGRRRK
jgi:hypothetical protein